jgi:hypothetical protein
VSRLSAILPSRWVTVKQAKLQSAELSAMSFYDDYATCGRIIKAFVFLFSSRPRGNAPLLS